jgi:hypothetical protein
MARIGDETKLKSFDEELEAEDWVMTQKLTPLTPSYTHVVPPCPCDSPIPINSPTLIIMRFFYANARGLLGECQALQTQEDDWGKKA